MYAFKGIDISFLVPYLVQYPTSTLNVMSNFYFAIAEISTPGTSVISLQLRFNGASPVDEWENTSKGLHLGARPCRCHVV